MYILVIDDNSDDRLLIIRELKREFPDLQVEEIFAPEGFEQALAASRFDLVTTDYQLGWSNGIEILRAIKNRYPDLPVIMFTDTGTQEIAVEAMKEGLDDYIIKSPKHYIRLCTAVRSALERTEAKRRATRIETRLQSLLNQLDVGVFRATLNGDLLEGNAAFLRLLGVSSLPEAQTIYLQELYLQRELSSLSLNWKREVQLRRNDDSTIWILLSETVSTTDDETVIDGFIEDISDRKRAEQQIKELNQDLERRVIERTAQLEAANKELEAFSYSVSHDLRAPLRIIDGFSQQLLERYLSQLDEKGKHYLQRVRAASQRMGELIDDLLKLSRVTRGELQRQTVDLSAMVEAIALELQHETERSVEFIIAPGVVAQGDIRLLLMVLENLLSNAWKFTSNKAHPRIEFGTLPQPDGKDAYFVRDNGAGFDMAYSHKLFGAFQRLHTTDEFPGTGIGLATVQRIIHRHGGRVWAEGTLEQGATFYFTLGY